MTDLVPVDNIAAVEALDPQAREAAVTHMLSEARAWLAHAVESTSPASIATFKAQMATVAEATKQLNLSKEIQLDAQEMVRRAERGVGQAVRKGQGERTVTSRGVRTMYGNRGGVITPSNLDLVFAGDLLPTGSERAMTYAVTDNVSDEQFDAALDAAKDEQNLSRANVVRKVREIKGAQPAKATPPPRSTRHADSQELLDRAELSLEALAASLSLVNPDELDPGAEQQIDSLTKSISAIRKAVNKIKESIHA